MLLDAKSEIERIERQIVDLSEKRNRLLNFVSTSNDLIECEKGVLEPQGRPLRTAGDAVVASHNLRNLIAPNASSVSVPSNRVWEAVSLVMGIANRPVTVPEIQDLLQKHKIIVGGEHPQENVRSALNRKEDIFERIGRGLYALRKWPESVKQMRKDEFITSEIS